MDNYKMQTEVKAMVGPEGYKGLGIYKNIDLPITGIDELTEPIKEFKGKMETLISNFEEEAKNQEQEIDEQLEHLDHFIEDSKKFHWDANPMFDRRRMQAEDQIFSLRRERRSLHKDIILKKISLEEKLADLKKELSPFKLF